MAASEGGVQAALFDNSRSKLQQFACSQQRGQSATAAASLATAAAVGASRKVNLCRGQRRRHRSRPGTPRLQLCNAAFLTRSQAHAGHVQACASMLVDQYFGYHIDIC